MKDFYLDLPLCFWKSARFLYNGQQKNYLYLKQQCCRPRKKYRMHADGTMGLTIEISSKGSRITGPEKILRHALAEIMNYYTYGAILMERVITFLFGSEKYEDYIALYKALPAILQQYGYRLIDKAIEGFALDIFVSLMRREKGFELEE